MSWMRAYLKLYVQAALFILHADCGDMPPAYDSEPTIMGLGRGGATHSLYGNLIHLANTRYID